MHTNINYTQRVNGHQQKTLFYIPTKPSLFFFSLTFLAHQIRHSQRNIHHINWLVKHHHFAAGEQKILKTGQRSSSYWLDGNQKIHQIHSPLKKQGSYPPVNKHSWLENPHLE